MDTYFSRICRFFNPQFVTQIEIFQKLRISSPSSLQSQQSHQRIRSRCNFIRIFPVISNKANTSAQPLRECCAPSFSVHRNSCEKHGISNHWVIPLTIKNSIEWSKCFDWKPLTIHVAKPQRLLYFNQSWDYVVFNFWSRSKFSFERMIPFEWTNMLQIGSAHDHSLFDIWDIQELWQRTVRMSTLINQSSKKFSLFAWTIKNVPNQQENCATYSVS